MINPALASIIVNPYSYVRSLCEFIAPNARLLDTTTIPNRDERPCRVVVRSSVNRISYSDGGIQGPVCAS